jgi:hypothetical protein
VLLQFQLQGSVLTSPKQRGQGKTQKNVLNRCKIEIKSIQQKYLSCRAHSHLSCPSNLRNNEGGTAGCGVFRGLPNKPKKEKDFFQNLYETLGAINIIFHKSEPILWCICHKYSIGSAIISDVQFAKKYWLAILIDCSLKHKIKSSQQKY